MLSSINDLPLVHLDTEPCRHITPRVDLAGCTDFRTWMAVACGASLAIGPDTALMNVASAMGTPGVTIVPTERPGRVVYPSATAVVPVRGVGKSAVFDVESFSDTVHRRFAEKCARPRDRSDYLLEVGCGDGESKTADVAAAVA